MSQYTPNTVSVRKAYAQLMHGWDEENVRYVEETEAEQEFDNWLAEELRKAKAQALEEAARELDLLATDFTINRGNYALEDDSPAQMIALASVTIRNLKDTQ